MNPVVDTVPNRRAIRARLAVEENDGRASLYQGCIQTHTEIPVCVVVQSHDGIKFQNYGIFIDMSRLRKWQMYNLASALACKMQCPVNQMLRMLFTGMLKIEEEGTTLEFLYPNHVLTCQWPSPNKQPFPNWQYFQES